MIKNVVNYWNSDLSPFMHIVEKGSHILEKSRGDHIAEFLQYVWPFFNIMYERVK